MHLTAHTESLDQNELAVEEKENGSPMDTESIAEDRLFEDEKPSATSDTAFDFTLMALSSINGLGRKGIASLVDAFKGNLGKVWKAPTQVIQKALIVAQVPSTDKIVGTLQNDQHLLLDRAGQDLLALQQSGVHIIPFKDLPVPLKKIPDYPRWLFVQGNPKVLYQKATVAVVGTRQPSERGRMAAAYVARLLAPYPITLVSGLAEGIDEEAHRASLIEGVTNVAFLGHGINFAFPQGTRDVRQQIIDRGGAVATEYLPNDHYRKEFFVERNRLQAALAKLVIPVEANPKGGTAHTIRFARKYKREIIGIKWKGANGILADLEAGGSAIIDIFSPAGSKQLDLIFRKLAKSARHKTYSLYSLERKVIREIQYRNVTALDVRRLIKAIRKAAKED